MTQFVYRKRFGDNSGKLNIEKPKSISSKRKWSQRKEESRKLSPEKPWKFKEEGLKCRREVK